MYVSLAVYMTYSTHIDALCAWNGFLDQIFPLYMIVHDACIFEKLVCVIYLCVLFRQVCHSTTHSLVGCVRRLRSIHLLERLCKVIAVACCTVGRIFNCLRMLDIAYLTVLHCDLPHFGIWIVLMLIIYFNIYIHLFCYTWYCLALWFCSLPNYSNKSCSDSGSDPSRVSVKTFGDIVPTLGFHPWPPSGPKGTREGSTVGETSDVRQTVGLPNTELFLLTDCPYSMELETPSYWESVSTSLVKKAR